MGENVMIDIRRKIAVFLVCAVAALAGNPANAAKITITGVGQAKGDPQIVIIPKNGRWDHVADLDIRFSMRVSAKFRGVHGTGGINRLKIQQREQHPLDRPLMYEQIFHLAKRTIGHTAEVAFDARRLTQRIRRKAIAQCNHLLSRGGAPDKSHRLDGVFSLPLRISVDGDQSVGFGFNETNSGGETDLIKAKNRDIRVAVICKPQPGYEKSHVNMAISSVTLVYNVIGEGTTCPLRVRRTIIVRGRRSGLFRVHLRGGGKKLGEFEVKVEQKGPRFIGRRVDEINMATTDEIHRIVVPGTNIKSDPVALKVPCGRAEVKALKLNVNNLKIAGTNSCPMKVRITATYETTRPGQFLGVLERSGVEQGGKQWVEPLTAKEKNGKYIAKIVKTQRFDDDFVYPVKYRAIAPNKSNLNTDWIDAGVRCSFKVKAAILTYKQEDKPTCPKKVTTTATFRTTAPGQVRFRFKSENGNFSDWFKVKAKLKDDKYVARYRGTTTYNNSFSASMTAVAAGPPLAYISPSTTQSDRIHRLTGEHPIRLTSYNCNQSRLRHNRG